MIAHLASVFQLQDIRSWIQSEAIGLKALNLPSESAREAYWRAFERRKAAFYPWAEKRVASQFRREMATVMDDIQDGMTNVDAIYLEEPAGMPWRAVLAGIHKRIGHTFARDTYEELNPGKSASYETKAEDLWLTFITEYIESMVAEHVVNIIQTTREAIRDSILEGLKAGEGVYELTQRIRSLYIEEIIPNRAAVIARTEAHAAASAGSLAAARATEKQTGLKLRKQWLSTRDARVRDAHRAADGQERELTEPFTVMSESLMFPGDSSLGASGANTVMCRCVSTYFTVR